ncbi:44174_t:CDS:2, partial [Gigaspora margarita]
ITMDIDIKNTVSNNYSNDDELNELTQTSEQYFKYDPKDLNSPIFPKLKKYQTQLSFMSIDPWPKQQKDERNN